MYLGRESRVGYAAGHFPGHATSFRSAIFDRQIETTRTVRICESAESHHSNTRNKISMQMVVRDATFFRHPGGQVKTSKIAGWTYSCHAAA